MGTVYKLTDQYVASIPDGNVIVEIGSERGEGSTTYFSLLAKKYRTTLYSVDVSSNASETLRLDNVVWAVKKGSEWTKKYRTIGKQISVLYLDNFDFIWDIDRRDSSPKSLWSEETYNSLRGYSWPQEYVEYDQLPEAVKKELIDVFDLSYDSMMRDMRAEYSACGMLLTNSECQLEHFKQLYDLKDWLADECIVIFDDTFRKNDCWLGKNAGGVLLLLTLGFSIVYESNSNKGLILKRTSGK